MSLKYDLSAGTHTIEIKVLDSRGQYGSDDYIFIDYIDVWDGTPLPEGHDEQDDDRLHRSGNWKISNDSTASGGSYIYDGSNVWFPFTGESFTFHTIANTDRNKMRLYLDGEFLSEVDLYHTSLITRTYSFGNLSEGAHVLRASSYRSRPAIDAVSTPAEEPYYEPTPLMTITMA